MAAGATSLPRALLQWWRETIVSPIDHEAVVARVLEESGWSPRFAFMTMMSAGIAVLGLLLSSPAVVIGAMLISPLMNPILGLGFSLAVFDFREMRRSITALAVATVAAVAFTALIVVLSPLKAATPEIIARTRPNLFDLLVALFAALAGAFAVIRGRGDTIVGVAIATALMPPLATVGYGLATWNWPVLWGASALFGTNLVTIALAATVMARWYGFGHRLSSQQTWTQTALLALVFVVMAAPLGVSLGRIAGEALTVSRVRAFLDKRFGGQARVTQLEVDFKRDPIAVRAVVIAPRARAVPAATVRDELSHALHQPLTAQVDEVLLDPAAGALARQQAELKAAERKPDAEDAEAGAARLLALAGGSPDAVTLDAQAHRAVIAAALPGATLATYQALEGRMTAALPAWTVAVTPPPAPLPTLSFARGDATLDEDARQAVLLSAWAAKRWHAQSLAVPGLAETPPAKPTLAQRRAAAIAALLATQGVAARSAPAAGQKFALSLQA
ncbi:MAG: DUF389 domain-containing protein [Caulobacteraceae bacterium]|nr:DUF389 domain-containing protein [Caulobacter sp.]